jgi:hypothetical protein
MIIDQEYPINLATQLEKLTIKNQLTNKRYTLSDLSPTSTTTPGQLSQHYSLKDFDLTLQLNFVSPRVVMVQTQFKNHTVIPLKLSLSWHGKILKKWDKKQSVKLAMPLWQPKIVANKQGINILLPKAKSRWNMMLSDTAKYQILRSTGITNIHCRWYSKLS